MSKRVLSLLMALVMLIGLVPATASAASLTTSEDAISVLKLLEGYVERCSADGSQYSYGYGTACTKDHSGGARHAISETDANAAMRKELEAIDKAINNFSASNGLGLSQQKHDALALFSYNCGTAWMKGSGVFRDAVVGGKTGNEFLYAITLWSNAGGQPSSILLNRRLAEANMYLNGVYSKTKPSNYTYVLFDGNGGEVSDGMQGYNSSGSVAIKVDAEREDHTFMGWYTDKGEWVPYLTKSVAGKTLYAHWQAKDAKPLDHVVSYTLSASQMVDKVMYSDPSTSSTNQGTVTADSVQIVRDYIDANGTRWAKISMKGWVKVGTPVASNEGTGSAPTNVVVTVTNTYINVRKGPSATRTQIGTVYYGEKLTIVAVDTASNGALWGELEEGGWIALMYTDYESVVEGEAEEEETPSGVIATAKVVCSSYVNVRAAAGTSNKLVGTLANGTVVNLYDIVTKNGHEWGETDKGWFCLDYATVTYLNSDSDEKDEEEKNENGETPIGSGVVVCATTVNVREGAGVSMPLVGSLKNGAMIQIYDIIDVYNHDWGRINATDWICLDYVEYTLNGDTGDKEEDKEEKLPYLYSGTVTGVSTELNVFAKASYDAEKIGSYQPNASIKILDVVSGVNKSGDAAVWGKVSNSDGKTGWVCLTGYVTIDPVSYIVTSNSLNVRKGAGTGFDSINKLTNGTVVSISKLAYASSGALWGYSETYGGWMNITSTYMSRANGYTSDSESKDDGSSTGSSSTGNSGSTVSTIVGKGIVTGGVAVKVRSGAGMGYGSVTTKNSGSEVTVYETVFSGGINWGRIDEGWVSMAYVYLTSTGVTGAGQMGTIANTYSAVNVRSAAGTSNTLMGKIFVNSRVEILETKNYGGKLWGRTTLGWVCMDYVLTDADAGVDMDDLLSGNIGGNTSSTTPGEATALSSYAGTVNTATSIYKEAGSTNVVGGVALSEGDSITLHELYEVVTKTTETRDDGAVVTTSYTSYWARIDEGWIEAKYVELDPIEKEYTVTCNKLNIRSGAGTHNSDIGDLFTGDVIEITDLKIVNASIWGYVEEENGWVNTASQYLTLGKVNTNTNTTPAPDTNTGNNTGNGTANNGAVENKPTANNPYGYLYTGTVVGTPAGTVNVRQTPSTGAAKTTALKEGAAVVIYELAVSENMAWGRCDAGWVSLVYVDLVPYNSTAVDARVVQSTTLNVYASADTASEVVTSYAKCKVIDIYEVNGHWARTADGWVYTYGTCLS